MRREMLLPALMASLLTGCGDGTGVTVTNGLGYTTIGAVYAYAREDSSAASVNRLSFALEPGMSEEISLSPGEWVLQAVDSEGRTYTRASLTVREEGIAVELTPLMCDSFLTTTRISAGTYARGAGGRSIRVASDLPEGSPVLFLHVREPGVDHWGPDLLGERILMPGETLLVLTGLDSLEVDAEGVARYTSPVLPVEEQVWTISERKRTTRTYERGEGDAALVLPNDRERSTVMFAWLTPEGGEPGEELLEGDFLRSGDLLIVRADPGTYDLLLESAAGRLVMEGIELEAGADTLRLSGVEVTHGGG